MYEFLSPEWVEAVRGIRDEFAPAVEAQAREAVGNVAVNLLVTKVPGGEDVRAHAAVRADGTALDLGFTPDATILVTVDYKTARSVVVDQDLQAVLRGFLLGKITIKGDLGAILGTEGADATALLSAFDVAGATTIAELDPTAGVIAERVRAVTV
jgi:hypothetical protein